MPDAYPPILFRPLLAGFGGLMGHHRHLLDDHVRTGAMIEAIARQVGDGDVVCELGAGTGVLCMAAARAGARRVYGIELSPIATLARRVIEDNGLATTVELLACHSRDARIPEPVDVLVSECLGVLGLGSTMIPWLAELRDRVLAPHGRIIPRRVAAWLAPVHDPRLARYVTPFDAPLHGFDFGSLAPTATHNLYNAAIDPTSLMGAPAELVAVDLQSAAPSPDAEGEACTTITRDCELHGLAGWFEADLGASVVLRTGPHDPPTVWRQVFLPLATRAVRAGQQLRMRLEFQGHEQRLLDIGWGCRIDDGPWDRHSTRSSHPLP